MPLSLTHSVSTLRGLSHAIVFPGTLLSAGSVCVSLLCLKGIVMSTLYAAILFAGFYSAKTRLLIVSVI